MAYGPNVNAAAVLLSSEGNVPVERTAMLMEALLGTPVSAGMARAHERLAQRLEQAGFDAAMEAALRAEQALCADETPVNLIRNTGEDGTVAAQPARGNRPDPHERLIWYATPSRSSEALKGLGVLGMASTASWSATITPGGPSSTPSSPGCSNAASTYPATSRACTPCTPTGSTGPKTSGRSSKKPTMWCRTRHRRPHHALDPALLADLRERYDSAVRWGEITNRLRDWDDGKNHPGYVLARRLKAKAEQIASTRNFAVPWTNNASEQAIKGPKRHQAVSGIPAPPGHPRPLLPRPLLPGHQPQSRDAAHRRHPRRPGRAPLVTQFQSAPNVTPLNGHHSNALTMCVCSCGGGRAITNVLSFVALIFDWLTPRVASMRTEPGRPPSWGSS